MKPTAIFRPAVLLVLLALFFLAADAQKKPKAGKVRSVGTNILWQPVNIKSQDLYYGSGGQAGMPNLNGITFIKEENGGYSTKYRIRDGSGRVWVAKLGKEAQSETAAVRFLSAIGYQTETVYLVPRLTIPGKGTFTNVRLEARPEDVKRGDEWKWSDNPFNGTPQLQGLKIMMAFFNNWDMKDSNNVILETARGDLYAISDLGATFGKSGISGFPLFRWIGRTRNEPRHYARSKFVRGVDDGRIKLSFKGKNYQELRRITFPQARWLADLLTQLSDRQIRDAFRSANYSAADIDLLTQAVKNRIAQLDRAASHRLAGTR